MTTIGKFWDDVQVSHQKALLEAVDEALDDLWDGFVLIEEELAVTTGKDELSKRRAIRLRELRELQKESRRKLLRVKNTLLAEVPR